MFSPNQQENDRAATIRSITKRLLVYWEERKLFMQDLAINIAKFTHESTEEQEESLQEEVLDFAPAALDDSLPEVEDPQKLVEHKLPIKEGYLPVKQARRRMSMDTELKVKEEIERLNLNEASPKDEYSMPMANILVDGAAHNQMLSFMDGNAWYNQMA
ncbi:unnamed protein product [Prunus armeniaca]